MMVLVETKHHYDTSRNILGIYKSVEAEVEVIKNSRFATLSLTTDFKVSCVGLNRKNGIIHGEALSLMNDILDDATDKFFQEWRGLGILSRVLE